MGEDSGQVPSIYSIPLILLILGALFFSALLCLEEELILLCLCLFGIIGLFMVWSRLGSRKLSIETVLDRDRLFPGESLVLKVMAKNEGFLPFWLRMVPPAGQEGGITCHGDRSGLDRLLLWYGSGTFEWRLAFHKRGVYRAGPETTVTGDPLGLFPRKGGSGISREVLIYPRLVPVADPKIPRMEFFGSPGSKSPVTDPVYVTGTRDYQPGSPSRFIHWRASARHQRWQEKVFQPSAREKVLLIMDTSAFARDLDRDGFEQVLEILASMAVQLDRRGVDAGFLSNGMAHGKGTFSAVPVGQRRVVTILEAFARLDMRPLFEIGAPPRETGPLPMAMVVIVFCRRVDAGILSLKALLEKRLNRVIIMSCITGSTSESGYGGIRSMDELRSGSNR